MNNIDYNICLWKHANKVVQSPQGVVYNCNQCEPNTIPAQLTRKGTGKKRVRRNKVRQTSGLVK